MATQSTFVSASSSASASASSSGSVSATSASSAFAFNFDASSFPPSSFPTFPGTQPGVFLSPGFNGNDFATVFGNNQLVFTRGGDDFVAVIGNNGTIDTGTGNDTVVTLGNNTVVFGGEGNDTLRGGPGNDSLWGGNGNDIIITGAGDDYALGGKGDDLTDTGTGLGIHFGGAGNDTFRIGAEIVGNGQKDTIIALDFGNGNDKLQIAPEILAHVASVKGGPIDLAPVLAQFAAEGLGVAEVGRRLGLTEGGSAAFQEVATFLAQFHPNAQGQILVDGTTVTTTEGDQIIALGVTPDQLLKAIGG